MRLNGKRIEDSWVLYGLLFLSCMNFMGRGPIVFFLFTIYGLIKTRKEWNNALIPYFFLSIAAVLTSLIFYDVKEILKVSLFFLSCYIGFVGYYSSIDKDKFIERLFLSAFAGSLVYLLLTYYLNFIVLGLDEGRRILVNYWTMEPNLPATCLGIVSSIIIIYSFYLILCKKNYFFMLIGVFSLLFTLFVSARTASRTPFVLFVVIYTLMLWPFFRGLKYKNKVRLVILACAIGVACSAQIANFFQESSLGARFKEEGMETSRWDITMKYFEGMTNHLWGGGYINKEVGKLAHNFIQESYDLYGVLFFIPLIFVCCGIGKRNLLLYKRVMGSNTNLILWGLLIGLFVQNLLEPTITGFPQVLWLLFMVDGIMIAKLYGKRRNFN